MNGKLSILISCYNQRDFIGQAIRSFFEQDYDNREIIVLDDGSSDDSLSVIASAAAEAPCTVLYNTQSNHGVSYTFRRLAEMNIPFFRRIPLIYVLWRSKAYSRFGRGWKNVIQDLFFR